MSFFSIFSINNLPYQLPQGGVMGGARHAPHLEKQLSHPLDGVVFNLSPKLATDSELDHMTMTVDSVMNRSILNLILILILS